MRARARASECYVLPRSRSENFLKERAALSCLCVKGFTKKSTNSPGVLRLRANCVVQYSLTLCLYIAKLLLSSNCVYVWVSICATLINIPSDKYSPRWKPWNIPSRRDRCINFLCAFIMTLETTFSLGNSYMDVSKILLVASWYLYHFATAYNICIMIKVQLCVYINVKSAEIYACSHARVPIWNRLAKPMPIFQAEDFAILRQYVVCVCVEKISKIINRKFFFFSSFFYQTYAYTIYI